MIRLFVSVKIPFEVKENLIRICKQIAPNPEKYRWETSAKIHLTIKFIGEVEENLVKDIDHELNFVEKFESLDFLVKRFGFFFRANEPKILWVGLETQESIYNLAEELNQRLSKFSIPVEKRRFKPHLTMLRIKNNPGSDFINKFKNYSFDNFNFTSREITLVKSRLSKTGAHYIDIKKYNLK